MKAYVYQGSNGLELAEKEMPRLNETNGAVIKVVACSICGTDVRTYRFGSAKIPAGRTVGHEIVGQITEVQPEHKKEFPIGSYISMAPAVGCGTCYNCEAGATNMCDALKTIGFEYDGGFAEYMGIPEQAFAMHNVYQLPETDKHIVYSLSEPLACAMNAQSYLKIGKADDVLIIGSGIIGCMHAELALHAGAKHVYISENSEARILQAQKLLPEVTFIHSAVQNMKNYIMDATGGKGADVVIVACSVGAAQKQGMQVLAKRGRISLFGGLPGESSGFIDSNLIHYREISVYGVHASTPEQNKAAMELIRDKRIDAEKYITKVYPLQKAGEAFKIAASGEAMKIVICEGE